MPDSPTTFCAKRTRDKCTTTYKSKCKWVPGTRENPGKCVPKDWVSSAEKKGPFNFSGLPANAMNKIASMLSPKNTESLRATNKENRKLVSAPAKFSSKDFVERVLKPYANSVLHQTKLQKFKKAFRNEAAKSVPYGYTLPIDGAIEYMKTDDKFKLDDSKLIAGSRIMGVDPKPHKEKIEQAVYRGLAYSARGNTPYDRMSMKGATTATDVANVVMATVAKEYHDVYEQARTLSYEKNRVRYW